MFPAETLPAGEAQMPLGELRACLIASQLWVAEELDFGVLGFISTTRHGAVLHLLEMDVLPLKSGKGIGAGLLLHLFHTARLRGRKAITLTTFEHLPWNAPFYAKNGFSEVRDLSRFPHLSTALEVERHRGFKRRVGMVKHLD